MLYHSSNPSLDTLKLVEHRAHLAVLAQRTAFARAHGHMPVGFDSLYFFAFAHALVAYVSEHIRFFTEHQCSGLRHVIDVRGCAGRGVNQARVDINADVCLHAEVPLVSFLGLVHFGITLAVLVLGRTGRGYQGDVHHRALLEHQAFIGRGGVDHGQYFRAQLVFFKQVAKTQDAAQVGSVLDAGEACKLAVQRGLEQGFFHGQVAQAEPRLQEMNAQHRYQPKRQVPGHGPLCMQRNQRQQLRPRHHHHHLVVDQRFACPPRAQVQSKFLLGHDAIVPVTPSSRHSVLAEVLNIILNS